MSQTYQRCVFIIWPLSTHLSKVIRYVIATVQLLDVHTSKELYQRFTLTLNICRGRQPGNNLSALLAWLQRQQPGAPVPPLPEGVSSLAEWYSALMDAGRCEFKNG